MTHKQKNADITGVKIKKNDIQVDRYYLKKPKP